MVETETEAEIMGKEFKETRDYYLNKIQKQGYPTLAKQIETQTPSKITEKGFIDGLKTAFPECSAELEGLKEEVEELQNQGQEAYDWTKYFQNPGNEYKKGFEHAKLAEDIMEEYEFKKLRDSEQIYVYKNGYYQPKGQQTIEEESSKRLGPEYEEKQYKKVKGYIEAKSYIKRKQFKPPKNKINLQNGVYDIQKEELLNHDPEYYFTHQIPLKYNPNAECPNIHEFLEEIVETEEEVKTLREIAGYSLIPDYPISKAFMLIGKGNNGKSLYLDLLKNLLGEENYVNKSLQELEENNFATSKLVGSLACIDDDLPSDKLRRTSKLKKLTGGSDIGAEIKYGDQFDFDNFAKFIFACNELPRTNDTTDGFYRRWVLVEFPYKFKRQPDPENKIEKQGIPRNELIEQVTSKKELEGFLWWVLEDLKDVLENNEFTHASTTEEAREKWKEYSEPLSKFISKYIRQGIGSQQAQDLTDQEKRENESLNEFGYDYIRKDFLRQIIGDYCEARSHSRPSKKAIKDELEKQGFYFNPKGRTRREPEDRRVRCYTGIQLKYPNPERCPGVPTYSSTFTRACAHTQVESSNQSVDVGTPPSESKENVENNATDTSFSRDRAKKVKEGIEKASDDSGAAAVDEVIDYAVRNSRAIEDEVEDFISKLKDEGEIFEPKQGFVQIL